jgi:hypothetical protein
MGLVGPHSQSGRLGELMNFLPLLEFEARIVHPVIWPLCWPCYPGIYHGADSSTCPWTEQVDFTSISFLLRKWLCMQVSNGGWLYRNSQQAECGTALTHRMGRRGSKTQWWEWPLRAPARGVVGNWKKFVYVMGRDLYFVHLHLHHARVPKIHHLAVFNVYIFYSLFTGYSFISWIRVLGIVYSCAHIKQKLNKRPEQISVELTTVNCIREVHSSNLGPVTSYPNRGST